MIKKITIALVFIFAGLTGFSQTVVTASTGRIGPFKPGMFKKDVEQIISKKIQIQPKNSDGYYQPTDINVDNNGVEYVLSFENYTANTDSATIISITTHDNRVKTLSGLGIGNTKDDLWNAYSDKYEMSISSVYQENTNTQTWEKVPGKRQLNIDDAENGNRLFFTLVNNIVTEIGLKVMEEGD